MAIVFDATSSAFADNDTVLSWSHTCSGDQRVLVVGMSIAGPVGISVETVTYGGVALSHIVTADRAGAHAELWYLVAPALGTGTIKATVSANSGAIIGGATSWTGVDQGAPLGIGDSADGSSTTASVAVNSASGEFVLDCVFATATPTITLSVGASQTQRWNTGPFDSQRGAGSHEAGAASVTMSWTVSPSAIWAIVAVPIKVSTTPTGTTVSEVWPIPARTEPFVIASGFDGLLAQALASRFPHLLAWRVEGTRFVWHDLGWLPAHAQLDTMGIGSVPLGTGVDPGLVLFGVEAHDGVVLTSLASSALGSAQRRFPDPGGVDTTDSGVLYASRVEFSEPNVLKALRIWGENFQQADIVRFAYRWDRGRWYSLGEIHGLPVELPVGDNEGGLFLEWVAGITDVNAWEPSLPIITRIEALADPVEKQLAPEADSQVPEIE